MITNFRGYRPYMANCFFILCDDDEPGRTTLSSHRFCREEFSPLFTPETKYVGYSYFGVLKPELATEFWRMVEDKLGIPHCPIHQIEGASDMIVLEVDPFWGKVPMRRGFFTLLLRAACCYYAGGGEGGFWKALESYHLSLGIMGAVKRFLSGHTTTTVPEIHGHNLVRVFAGRSEGELEQMLVKFYGA